MAGARAGPGSEVPHGREHGHIEPAFGDQDLRGVRLDAWDRGEQLDDVTVRGEHEFDPLGQVLQFGVERVDVREQLRDHHAVVLDREAALKCFAELRDLGAHPSLGEFGELIGIGHAGQQRFEHGSGGLRVARGRDA